jgi:hypothetical protein
MPTRRKPPKRQESFAAGVGRGMRRAARTARRFTFGRMAKSLRRILTTMRNRAPRVSRKFSRESLGSVAELPKFSRG